MRASSRVDPYIPEAHFAAHGVQRVDLPTLLAESDVVTLHVYVNRETRHMIGAAEFAHMKPTAVLLNAARGPIVDEPALVEALQHKRIAGAALDVFETEPLPLDSPLRGLGDCVLLSPHMVTNNVGSGIGPAIDLATGAVMTALRGEVPDEEIIFNREAIPQWKRASEGDRCSSARRLEDCQGVGLGIRVTFASDISEAPLADGDSTRWIRERIGVRRAFVEVTSYNVA